MNIQSSLENHIFFIQNTSLAEIQSYNPCKDGWENILAARKLAEGKENPDYETKFSLVSCLGSNCISDTLWLLGKKGNSSIAIEFMDLCLRSIAYINNINATKARNQKAALRVVDITPIRAYGRADLCALYAAGATPNIAVEEAKQKQFLIQCINEYELVAAK